MTLFSLQLIKSFPKRKETIETEDYSFVNDSLFKKEEEGGEKEERPINREEETRKKEAKEDMEEEEEDPLSINAMKEACKLQKEGCSK